MIPKLIQNKEGNWTAKIGGKRVDFKTKDYFQARERAREASENGTRHFTQGATAATDEPSIGGGGSTPPPATSDWTADAVRAAGAAASAEPAPPPPKPEERADYFPPGISPEPGIPHDTPSTPPEVSTEIPPEMMAGLIRNVADTIVELQLHGQEYLFIRWGKREPGAVPLDHDARTIPRVLWETQLKKWLPTDIPLPEWAVAILLCGMMGGTVQFEGSKPLPQKSEAVQ